MKKVKRIKIDQIDELIQVIQGAYVEITRGLTLTDDQVIDNLTHAENFNFEDN